MNYRNIYLKFDKAYQTLRTIRDFHRDKKDIREHLKGKNYPELTTEEKLEIDEYWKKYGIKYRNYDWFKYFYGFTGIHSPRFIHNSVHGHIVVPYWNMKNSKCYVQTYSDKNYLYDLMPRVNFPEPILKKVDGCFYTACDEYIGYDTDAAIDILMHEKDVIAKPAIESECGCGRDVKRYTLSSRSDAEELLDDKASLDNMIVQKVIRQHRFFSQFNDSSVNVIRVNTWCHNGEVDIYTPVLRFGYPGCCTDIRHVDGKEDFHAVGITLDGYMREKVYSYWGGYMTFETLLPTRMKEFRVGMRSSLWLKRTRQRYTMLVWSAGILLYLRRKSLLL